MKAETLFSVKDKVILLTGASQGIGRSLAKLYVTNGAKVALIARNKNSLETIREELGNENVAIFPFDVTITKQIPKMVKQVYEHFGAIDVLVNNAGKIITKPAIEFSEIEWDEVIDLNLRSVFFPKPSCLSVYEEKWWWKSYKHVFSNGRSWIL